MKEMKISYLLSEKYEGDEDIVLQYAYGLAYLSDSWNKELAKESVRRLKELSEKYKIVKEFWSFVV